MPDTHIDSRAFDGDGIGWLTIPDRISYSEIWSVKALKGRGRGIRVTWLPSEPTDLGRCTDPPFRVVELETGEDSEQVLEWLMTRVRAWREGRNGG